MRIQHAFHQPVSLIVANAVNEVCLAAEPLREHLDAVKERENKDPLVEALARGIVVRAAAHASLAQILAALAAIGAPATEGELAQRIQAHRDAIAAEQKGVRT